jgi:hypothetical protein
MTMDGEVSCVVAHQKLLSIVSEFNKIFQGDQQIMKETPITIQYKSDYKIDMH